MTINDQIKDEKLQYDINREAAKISALSSGKLHKYEYLTGEDILPSNQQQIIEPTKFTYSPLGKAFDKQIKRIEDQGKKQVDALNTLKSDNKITKYLGEIQKGAKKSKEQENTIYNIEMLYKARNEAIKFYDDYSLMMSKAKSKAKQNETKGTGLKILIPKQRLQRLSIALAQVNAGNNSENLLNKIRQIIYSLYQSKEITKKVYNNLMKSL